MMCDGEALGEDVVIPSWVAVILDLDFASGEFICDSSIFSRPFFQKICCFNKSVNEVISHV